MLLEQQDRLAGGGGPSNTMSSTGFRNRDMGESSRFSGGYGNFSQSSPRNHVVADRWKGLDSAHPMPRHVSQGGFYSSGDASGHRSRQTVTGTHWDTRDGRRWRPENMEEIFKKDKDKATGINFDCYDAIPVDLSGRGSEAIEPIASFRETRGIHPLLAENILRVQYEKPTPVQKHSISVILSGRDLMACAQTGSGKTAAFLFPIITKMLNEGPPRSPPSEQRYRMRPPAYPVALVLSPTRELAVQIYEESRKFSYGTGIRTVVVYGGSEVKSQLIGLENGCDICVATPGRLSDLMKRARVGLKLIKYLVLDEADRMLDMGFAPQITSIVQESEMPTSAEGRQTVMFSATFPNVIQRMAADFLRDYLFLTVGRVGSTNDFITQHLIYANEHSKPKRLLSILAECKGGLMLVFVETKKKADLIENFLLNSGLAAVSIHGDKSQHDRERALQLFRTGDRPILVATDVAARGLDIHNIEHVINCDLPARIDDYVHRIGRTGRAGNRGKATSFVNEKDRPVLRDLLGLLEEAQQEIPTWFYEMVKSCTSAHRAFGSGGGGSMFGKSARGQRSGFGGRDVRGGERSNNMMGSSSTMRHGAPSNGQFQRYNDTQRRCGADVSFNKNDDEEDGW